MVSIKGKNKKQVLVQTISSRGDDGAEVRNSKSVGKVR